MEQSVKILVMSDNHFQAAEVNGILAKHAADSNFMIHCGDSQWNIDDPHFKDMIVVRGNNDFQKFPDEEMINVLGKNIFITHGHHQYVYYDGKADNTSGTKELVTYAKAQQADIIFYGHTHVPEFHLDEGVFVLNPGSTNFPRNYRNRIKTYAVVTLTETAITARFYDASTHEDVSARI